MKPKVSAGLPSLLPRGWRHPSLSPLRHPSGSAASRIPRNGPFFLESASGMEGGLARKEIPHCREKRTSAVGLFSS